MTAYPQHIRRGGIAQVWRNFRIWRRTRPFWAGFFTTLSGLEIFATTQMTLGGLSFQMGPTGFLSWLIPAILIAAGLLMLFTPQQRMFYATVASVTAVFSLIAVNLGGFFLGMLFGMVGGALGYAWVPARSTATPEIGDPSDPDDGGGQLDETPTEVLHDAVPVPRDGLDGLLTDTLPPPRNPLREPAAGAGAGQETVDDPTVPGQADTGEGPAGRHRAGPLAVTLVVLTLGAAMALVVPAEEAAFAAPCRSTGRPLPQPTASATTSPAPSQSPEPGPTVSPEPAAALSPTATTDGTTVQTQEQERSFLAPGEEEPATARTTPATARSTAPTTAPAPTPCVRKPIDDKPGKVPTINAEAEQPAVNKVPSRLTGTKVTMYGMRMEGIVDLPTVDGTIRVLRFTMDKAVARDSTLEVPGGKDRVLPVRSSTLTIEGNVSFYATRFVGEIRGVTVTLTPESPLPPDGVDLDLPVVTFDDPEVQLVFVGCDKLTAENHRVG